MNTNLIADMRLAEEGMKRMQALGWADLMRRGADALESLATQPAPSGWQQRIAAMDPWRGDRCFFCAVDRFKCTSKPVANHDPIYPPHEADCLWQNAVDASDFDSVMRRERERVIAEANAVDALPPEPEVKDAIPPQPPDFAAFLKSLENGLSAVAMFMGEGRHLHDCNADEDGPCDCGYVEPEDVVEALLMDVRSRKDALPADPIASAVRAELQPLEDALINAGHKLANDDTNKERACCRSDHDGWCCTLRDGHAGEHVATNKHEFDVTKLRGKVFARWA
jgi:hypothetical protein